MKFLGMICSRMNFWSIRALLDVIFQCKVPFEIMDANMAFKHVFGY